MAEPNPTPTPTPPFVLHNPKVAHVRKEGDDWVPDPTQPARLQGEVGDTYPGVPAGQTAPYTSSIVAFLAAMIFRTESDKLITVVWEDLTGEERRAFLPLLQRLLMKTRPVPAPEEVVVREGVVTEEQGRGGDDAVREDDSPTPPEGTRVPPGLLPTTDDPPPAETT